MMIRPATLDDLPTLVEYNRRLAQETENITLSVELLTEGVRAALLDPSKGRYFVAEVDGQVVGQLMHTHEWSDWRNGDIWWLQSVYVHSDYRQQGVFRQLVEHLRAEAQATPGVVGLRLYMEEHNDRAAATYDRLGIRNAGYVVREQIWRNWETPNTGK
ncbi:MAG: GNAT family N-acetyltransferase [Planctomycetaceae bacterium]